MHWYVDCDPNTVIPMGKVAQSWGSVTCSKCCHTGIRHFDDYATPNTRGAAARLVELTPAMTASTTPPTYTFNDDGNITVKMGSIPPMFETDVNRLFVRKTGPVEGKALTFPTIIIKDYFANPDHSALLLRAASFIADLPSGSLDRVRNVEAMNLIRALRDAVVPADKPKLSTSNVKVK